ncbi:MAG: polyprenyl synthetase family protein [Hyphomicrobiales bacterium]|nr:polyprenyl synthetase family protein [Hyphomicrobiales bacterium]
MPDTGQTDLAKAMTAAAAMVEQRLDELLSPALRAQEQARPARLLAAMRHAALAGGKRIRPFLLIETAGLFGVAPQRALQAGVALEMVHCYSLVHDDLPAMDDDDMRRGRPTVHRAFDEATAILAGDALLTLAFDVMADAATDADADIRIKLVAALAQAAGPGGMAGGQALDLAAETAAEPLDSAAIRQLQAMKTGALLAFAVTGGAILGRASPAQHAALARYGAALGAAFQIADDILDATGNAENLGKKAGKDAARNKATLVARYGLASARAMCQQQVEAALAALQQGGFGRDAARLASLASYVASRET